MLTPEAYVPSGPPSNAKTRPSRRSVPLSSITSNAAPTGH